MGFDAANAFKMEKDLISIVKHNGAIDNVEKELLGPRYPSEVAEGVDLSRYFYIIVYYID